MVRENLMAGWAIAASMLALGVHGAPVHTDHIVDGKVAVRAGFYIGNDFNIGARETHLEGFEVGADVRLLNQAKLGEIALSPTVTFGGSNRSGADADGNIYRILFTLRHPVSSNVYAGFGLGWSGVQARVH